MRRFIISILLAGAVASPALAQDHGRWHQDEAQSSNQQSSNQQSREDRSQAREQRQEMREQGRAERFNGGANVERMQQVQQQQVQQQQVQQQQAARQFEGRQQRQGGGGWDRSRFEGQQGVTPQQVIQQQQQQQQAERNYRGYRGRYSGQQQQVDQAQRDGAWSRNRGSWSQNRDGDFRQREVQQQQQQQQRMRQGGRWASGGWNRDWRNDRRYDWRNYRDRHRSVFHLGFYFDPFGYGYRQFDIGYNLAPRYFGQQYWIDPAMYQLPYPPPGTVWVRYWNDAVLVDTYSGEVVDVIHNFFW